MEMFNGGSLSKGYEEYNPREYDDMLSGGKKIFCVGGDDNHNSQDVSSRYCDSGWAFTMIKAETVLSENDVPVTEAVFNAPPEVGYFRITVIDKRGRHACTNAYFVGNLK